MARGDRLGRAGRTAWTLGVVLGALAFPAIAEAGSVRLQTKCPEECGGPDGPVFVWEGEPGEANDVAVTRDPDGTLAITERSPTARLVAGSPECRVVLNSARCSGTQSTYFVVLYGHDGDDQISTDALHDSKGQFGDILLGGSGEDVLDGGDHLCCVGAWMDGGVGDDVMRGGTGVGDAVLYRRRETPIDASLAPRPEGARNGEVGEQDVIAENVDDLWGGQANDLLFGDDGDNYIYAEDGADVLRGGGGTDVLWAWSGWWDPPDQVYGEDGGDRIYPGARFELVDGGAGRDAIRIDNQGSWFLQVVLDGIANDGAIVDHEMRQEPQVPEGQVIEVEDIRGAPGSALLVGDAGPNLIQGEDGSDIIAGLAGPDVLDADWAGGEGEDFVHALDGEEDVVRCGAGLDVVIADPDDEVEAACDEVSHEDVPLPELEIPTVDRPPGPGPGPTPLTVTFVGLPTGGSATVISAPPASDSNGEPPTCVQPPAGSGGTVNLGTARDDCLMGGPRGDRLRGRAGADRLIGAGGDDQLRGGTGDDWIDAGTGRDRVYGEAGGDFVIAGRGSDRISGGKGPDFVVAADGRRDAVACGSGRDRAVVDVADVVRGCERVARTRPTRR